MICYDITDLPSRTICEVWVTTDPIQAFKELKATHLRLYRVEEEAKEGAMKAIICDSKVTLSNGSIFGCQKIDLSQVHLIAFYPDSNFDVLHTGSAKEFDPFNIKDDFPNDAKLIICTSEGPTEWTKGILEESLELPDGEYALI